MTQKEILEKAHLGLSELTGKIYLFIPDKYGNAKVQVDITEQFFHFQKKVALFRDKIHIQKGETI